MGIGKWIAGAAAAGTAAERTVLRAAPIPIGATEKATVRAALRTTSLFRNSAAPGILRETVRTEAPAATAIRLFRI